MKRSPNHGCTENTDITHWPWTQELVRVVQGVRHNDEVIIKLLEENIGSPEGPISQIFNGEIDGPQESCECLM
jgi:hypothetical protein